MKKTVSNPSQPSLRFRALFNSTTLPYQAVAIIAGVAATHAPLTTAQQPDVMLEEVVVTAQKREQSVSDIGMSIAAYRGEDLETLGLSDTRDMANLVPGLTMAMSDAGTPIYTMRGIGFNTRNMSSTSPVGVYFDEASYPFAIMTKGLTFDIERVEILKGPQGTLYGRNTTGGLVNYISNKPNEIFESSLQFEYGSYETFGFVGMINGPLADTVNARLAVKSRQSNEGWQKSVSRDEQLGEIDKTAVKLALNWEVNDDLTALFSANWWSDQSDTQAGQAILYNPEAFTPANQAQALALFGPGGPADIGAPAGTTGQQLVELMYVQPGLRNAILTNPTSKDADWAAPDQPANWPGTTFSPRPTDFSMDQEMLSLAMRIDWTLSDTTAFTSLTTYADLTRDDLHDRDATGFELVVHNDAGSIESFSQEIRLQGDHDTIRYIAGLFLSFDELEETSNPWAGQTSSVNRLRVLVPASAALAGVTNPAVLAEIAGGFRNWQNTSSIDSESRAVFGQVEWDIHDTVTVTAGLRYTEDETDFKGCSRDAGNGNLVALWNAAFQLNIPPGGCVTNEFAAGEGPYPAPVDIVKDTLKEDNLSGRLGLNWNLSDNTMLWGSFTRGFKSGAFPQLSANVASQYSPAVQEEVNAYEIGLKTSLADNTVQLNASTYYYDYTDKQVFGEVLDPIFTTLTRLINVPESEVQGAELDITWQPNNHWTTKLGLAYMDTEIIDYTGYDKFGQQTDFAGSEFEYSPHLQATALISYGFELSSDIQGRVTLDIAYSSEQQSDFEGNPAFAVDAYTLLGLNLALFTDNDWQASVWVKNLTDEYYWHGVHTATDTTQRYAGMPRTMGVSFTLNF